MSKILKLRTLTILLLLAWMVCIFIFSSQHAEDSSETSGQVVTKVIEVVYPEYEELPREKQISINDVVTLIVRKLAHFLEYFVLGVLSFVVMLTYREYQLSHKTIVSFIICLVYAASDEIHQCFVPGRACRFSDVLIDCSGSILAILLCGLIFAIIEKSRKKSGENNA